MQQYVMAKAPNTLAPVASQPERSSCSVWVAVVGFVFAVRTVAFFMIGTAGSVNAPLGHGLSVVAGSTGRRQLTQT